MECTQQVTSTASVHPHMTLDLPDCRTVMTLGGPAPEQRVQESGSTLQEPDMSVIASGMSPGNAAMLSFEGHIPEAQVPSKLKPLCYLVRVCAASALAGRFEIA
jgi:hypothetical protein